MIRVDGPEDLGSSTTSGRSIQLGDQVSDILIVVRQKDARCWPEPASTGAAHRVQILRHAINGFYLMLTSDVQEPPSVILDVFEGRVKLIAFNQESDEPRVVVEFGDKGEILHVEINGVPHANVVHQP